MLSDSPVPQTMKGQELEEEMAKISTMARKTRTANLKKLVESKNWFSLSKSQV